MAQLLRTNLSKNIKDSVLVQQQPNLSKSTPSILPTTSITTTFATTTTATTTATATEDHDDDGGGRA